MSRENPWAKHRQSFWQEKAGSLSLPLWLRVAALAYGGHRRNGHTPFKAGEIALGTTVVDPHSGEVKQPVPAQVSRAIRTAVEYGFLHRSSCARCLVVPPWGVEGGMVGSPNEPCRLHRLALTDVRTFPSGSKNPRKFDSESQTTLHSESNDNALTCDNAARSRSLLIPHPTDQPDQEATA